MRDKCKYVTRAPLKVDQKIECHMDTDDISLSCGHQWMHRSKGIGRVNDGGKYVSPKQDC